MTAIAAAPPSVLINLKMQVLELRAGDKILQSYKISTATNGGGEKLNSFCTPRGRHIIRAKIGGAAAVGSVFVARRFTGEIYRSEMAAAQPERDWILTRILWLSGVEPGKNRGGDVDTMRRHIYIHGTPDAVKMGTPGSIGCIRMRNAEVVELFLSVKVGTLVVINE